MELHGQPTALDQVAETIQEGPPVEFALLSREIASLVPTLATRSSHCETNVQPLWHLDPNAWDYGVMKSLQAHDIGLEISFDRA